MVTLFQILRQQKDIEMILGAAFTSKYTILAIMDKFLGKCHKLKPNPKESLNSPKAVKGPCPESHRPAPPSTGLLHVLPPDRQRTQPHRGLSGAVPGVAAWLDGMGCQGAPLAWALVRPCRTRDCTPILKPHLAQAPQFSRLQLKELGGPCHPVWTGLSGPLVAPACLLTPVWWHQDRNHCNNRCWLWAEQTSPRLPVASRRAAYGQLRFPGAMSTAVGVPSLFLPQTSL